MYDWGGSRVKVTGSIASIITRTLKDDCFSVPTSDKYKNRGLNLTLDYKERKKETPRCTNHNTGLARDWLGGTGYKDAKRKFIRRRVIAIMI